MKKEFSTLIQFIIIAGLVAVFFSLTISQQYSESITETNNTWLKYWLYSFIGLSAIRFGLFYVIFRKAFIETNKSLLKIFLGELAKTFQYFIIAVFSTFGVFGFFLLSISRPGVSYDLLTIWYGIHQTSLEWLTAFSVLSSVRLGLVGIWNSFSLKKLEKSA